MLRKIIMASIGMLVLFTLFTPLYSSYDDVANAEIEGAFSALSEVVDTYSESGDEDEILIVSEVFDQDTTEATIGFYNEGDLIELAFGNDAEYTENVEETMEGDYGMAIDHSSSGSLDGVDIDQVEISSPDHNGEDFEDLTHYYDLETDGDSLNEGAYESSQEYEDFTPLDEEGNELISVPSEIGAVLLLVVIMFLIGSAMIVYEMFS